MRLKSLCGLAAAAYLSATAFAAEPPAPPRYFLLHQEIVKPSAVKEYEATSREFVVLVTKNRDVMPHFNAQALMSDDFTYTFVLPMADMATIDQVNAEFGALAQKTGTAFSDLMKRNNATIDHVKEWVVQPMPEVSYRPEKPRLRDEEVKFRHVDVHFVMPEREADVEPLAREFKALFAKKGIADGYNLYRTALGPDMPALVVSVGARDAADFYGQRGRASSGELASQGSRSACRSTSKR